MARLGITHFYPERIVWIGAAVLSLGVLLCIPFLWSAKVDLSPFVFVRKKEKKNGPSPCQFSLGLSGQGPGLSIPDLRDEMTFSFDPPRPDGESLGKRLLVRMKQSAESKRVVLPCRLDLEFQGDLLKFSKEKSLFWVDLELTGNGEIEGKGAIATLEGERIEAGGFTISGEECPIQGAQEFAEGSPFRLRAEARWWGRDQFRGDAASGERIEIGADLIEVREGDWLVWENGKWEKKISSERDSPMARIQSSSAKAIILEGWESDGYTRIALNSSIGPPFKVKGEDLFGSLRVRSEKQISCTLEKQCMVLKMGDWVLKMDGRWKILRKKEERDAFLNGKLFGELFILEQISQRQGQKMIQGRLFNPGRTQVVLIEMAAQSGRKIEQKGQRKGKLQ